MPFVRFRGHASTSGIPFEHLSGYVVEVREERIAYFRATTSPTKPSKPPACGVRGLATALREEQEHHLALLVFGATATQPVTGKAPPRHNACPFRRKEATCPGSSTARYFETCSCDVVCPCVAFAWRHEGPL